MNLLSSIKNWGKDSLVKFGKEIYYQRKDQELLLLKCCAVSFIIFLGHKSQGATVPQSFMQELAFYLKDCRLNLYF